MDEKPREQATNGGGTCQHVVGTLKVRGQEQEVRCGAPAKKTSQGWRCADHFPKVAG